MHHKTTILSLAALLAGAPIAATAGESAEALHKKHCQRCHDDSIYTRPEPLVLTYSALGQRVRMCDNVAGAHLSERELQSVIDYLNDRFYKFEKR